MKKWTVGLSLLLLCSPAWGFAGTKEEIIRLQSDVLQLQNLIRLLQKNADENNGIVKSLLEQLNDQVAKNSVAMANLVRRLQNQKADFVNSIAQMHHEVQNLSVQWDDTNNRIASLQRSMEANRVQVQTFRQVPSRKEPGATIELDQVYNAVYNDYLMGDYDLAVAGFQDFLTNYPNTEYADNALYYLGVCYNNQGRYEQAVETFDQAINLYPKADKTVVAYYKKALALQNLQKNSEAIDTFKKLATIFPDSQEAALARQELEKLGVDLRRR